MLNKTNLKPLHCKMPTFTLMMDKSDSYCPLAMYQILFTMLNSQGLEANKALGYTLLVLVSYLCLLVLLFSM